MMPGEGRKRAKARGVKFGRPRKMTPHQRQEALQRLRAGETIAAEQGNQRSAGIRRNGKREFAQLVIDETEQVSFRIGVARQCRAVRSMSVGYVAEAKSNLLNWRWATPKMQSLWHGPR